MTLSIEIKYFKQDNVWEHVGCRCMSVTRACDTQSQYCTTRTPLEYGDGSLSNEQCKCTFKFKLGAHSFPPGTNDLSNHPVGKAEEVSTQLLVLGTEHTCENRSATGVIQVQEHCLESWALVRRLESLKSD